MTLGIRQQLEKSEDWKSYVEGDLVGVSAPVMRQHDQSKLERKGLFDLHFHIMVITENSQDSNSHMAREAGTDAEAIEEWSLLAYFSWFA